MGSIEHDFRDLLTRLRRLEDVYNPEGHNLHFSPLAQADADLYANLLILALDGLAAVRKQGSYFLEHRLYDDGKFWYGLFLTISSAGMRVADDDTRPTISEDSVAHLVDLLVDISEYTILGGDITKRNHEALSSTLRAFQSDDLFKQARKRAQVIGVRDVQEFVELAIKAAPHE